MQTCNDSIQPSTSTTRSMHAMESSETSRLLSLPLKVRRDIYRRVLVVPHPLYLFTEGASDKIELFAPERPAQWLALLRTNRQLCSEASLTVYESHQFVLVDTAQNQSNLLRCFLDHIGSVNASYLTHMCINFPISESAALQEDDSRVLNLLRERCSNLTTLEMLMYGQNSQGLVTAGLDSKNSQPVREVLWQLDARLRDIPSLRRIHVRLYSGGSLAPKVAELMQSFAWVVSPG